jgi:D-glycero-alpha-D-manno-heptose-7-phosphate kinase
VLLRAVAALAVPSSTQRSAPTQEEFAMIIARAPLRISLAGGGTDLPAYADRFGGLVISATIDRYVYTILSEAEPDVLQITAADANSFCSRRAHLFDGALFWGDDYRLPLATFEHFGIGGGYRLFIAPEVPSGTGLGSSSTTAVALITAITAAQGSSLPPSAVAELACHLEIDQLRMPIGRQDQYAAAFGGLNVITFEHGETTVVPCPVTDQTVRDLQERLLLFFTGQRRRSTTILTAQRDATEQASSSTLAALHDIKALARVMNDALRAGDVAAVGQLLDESWTRKRRLAPGVSTPQIDAWYDEAKAAGALGGKITGAGGGGFLLLFAEPERRREVIARMSELGLMWVDTKFEWAGATAVLTAPAQAALV